MVNPLQPVFDILRGITHLGEGLWDGMAFHPVIQNNPGISFLVASVGVLYLKSRGSNDERESSDAFEEWTIDVLAGAWVSLFHDIPEALGSILEGIGKGIGSGIRKIRESENFSLIGGSLIDLSPINWKTIFLGVLGVLGVSAGAVLGWFNRLF